MRKGLAFIRCIFQCLGKSPSTELSWMTFPMAVATDGPSLPVQGRELPPCGSQLSMTIILICLTLVSTRSREARESITRLEVWLLRDMTGPFPDPGRFV